MTSTETVISRVEFILQTLDISHNKFAVMLGVDKSYISKLMNKKCRLTLEMVDKMADVLGVNCHIYLTR